MVKRFEIFLVDLNPTIGSELKKTRPCIIISPNELNKYLRTVIIAPMSSKKHNYSYRININFNNREGQIILDQIRTIDKSRLNKYLGTVSLKTSNKILETLKEMFS